VFVPFLARNGLSGSGHKLRKAVKKAVIASAKAGKFMPIKRVLLSLSN
jgi:hypothetical protein